VRRSPAAPTLAFAGAGMISVVHGMAAQLAGLPVVAVASRTSARAEERAGQLGARPCTYAELPAGADAVVVATPPASHAAGAIAALEAGAGVLVEKPLATTLADADQLVAAARAAGRPVVYAENLAFAVPVRHALAGIAELGAVDHLEARSLQPRPTWGGFLDPAWGGGVLFDLGVHPLALVLLAAGADQVADVSAALDASDDLVVDDHAVVDVRFASGRRARVEASWRHPTAAWDLQAASDTGVVRLELRPDVLLERNGEPVVLPAGPTGADPRLAHFGYVEQLEALALALTGGPASPIDGEFGRLVLEVVCAAYASAGRGEPVALPFAGPRDRTPLELWQGG
jgi:myo-inositol 2-dehydrogenase/D-chiro-inositol 1-dehydrogenase